MKIIFPLTGREFMARKYSRKASAKVGRAMKKRKSGTLKSGRSGRKVKSRKQAIAIGLSEARAEGKKVPAKRGAKKRKTAPRRDSGRSAQYYVIPGRAKREPQMCNCTSGNLEIPGLVLRTIPE